MNLGTVQRLLLSAVLVCVVTASGRIPEGADRLGFHTRLESSTPSDGDTIRTPIDTIVLTFNNPVQVRLSAAIIDLASGDSIVLHLRQDPADEMTLLADAMPLAAGPARLRWTTAAADGHKVNGSIQFVVSGEAAQAWSPTAAAPIGEPGAESAEPVAAPAEWSDVVEPAGRRLVPILVSGAGSLFLLTLTGLLFFLATTREPMGPDPKLQATTVRAALFLASLAAAMLMIEVIVWARDVSAGGADGVFAAMGTATGRAGLARAIFAFAALVALQFTGGRGRGAVVLAVLAVLAGSTAGHPASFSPAISMPANAIHQVAAAVWAGGLVYLVLVCGAARTESSGLTCASAVQRVSGAAVVAIIAVTVSGALQTWLFLPDLAALTGTRYGQLALAKTAGLLVLAGFGAYHRFRLMPALADAGDEADLTRSVRREIWVMGIVVFIAAFLAHASPEAG